MAKKFKSSDRIFIFNDDGALKIPSGDSSERPSPAEMSDISVMTALMSGAGVSTTGIVGGNFVVSFTDVGAPGDDFVVFYDTDFGPRSEYTKVDNGFFNNKELILPDATLTGTPTSSISIKFGKFASTGFLRLNTDIGSLEVWDGETWVSYASANVLNDTQLFVKVAGDEMEGTLGVIPGTQTEPSVYFVDSPNTGIYSPSPGVFALTSNGSEDSLVIDIQGNLGIGTSSPIYSLHVERSDAILVPSGSTGDRPASPDDGLIRYNEDINRFEFRENGVWTDLTRSRINNIADTTWVETEESPASEHIEFGTKNQVRVVISSAGNVGIGDLDPKSKLSLVAATENNFIEFSNSNIAGSPHHIGVSGNNSDLVISTQSDSDIKFNRFGSPALIIKDGETDFQGNRITSLASPIDNQDAVNKEYVDALIEGLDWKDSVDVATTSPVELSGYTYVPGNEPGGNVWTGVVSPVFDGIAVTASGPTRRVLIKNASDPRGNGIFFYDGVNQAFIRSKDADNSPTNEVSNGLACYVSRGNTQGGTAWLMSSPLGDISLGTDGMSFVQFGGTGLYTGGNNITISSTNVIDLESTILVSGQVIALDVAKAADAVDPGDLVNLRTGDDRYLQAIDGQPGDVLFNISGKTYEPDQVVIVGDFVTSDLELSAAQTGTVDQAELFNSWYRFVHLSAGPVQPFTNDPSEFIGEQSAWSYNSVDQRVQNTTNSVGVIGMVSLDKSDEYTIDTQIGSTRNDDDMIGICIAFVTEGIPGNPGYNEHHLAVFRNNNSSGYHYYVVYNQADFGSLRTSNGAGIRIDLTSLLPLGTAYTTGGGNDGVGNGWNEAGVGCPLKVERIGDQITVWSNDMGTTAIDNATQYTFSLTDYPELEKFRGKTRYGFIAQSQTNSFWDATIISSKIYALHQNDTYEFDGSSWNSTGNSVDTEIGLGRMVANPETNKLFYIRGPNDYQKIIDGSFGVLKTYSGPVKNIGQENTVRFTSGGGPIRLPEAPDGFVVNIINDTGNDLPVRDPNGLVAGIDNFLVTNSTAFIFEDERCQFIKIDNIWFKLGSTQAFYSS